MKKESFLQEIFEGKILLSKLVSCCRFEDDSEFCVMIVKLDALVGVGCVQCDGQYQASTTRMFMAARRTTESCATSAWVRQGWDIYGRGQLATLREAGEPCYLHVFTCLAIQG